MLALTVEAYIGASAWSYQIYEISYSKSDIEICDRYHRSLAMNEIVLILLLFVSASAENCTNVHNALRGAVNGSREMANEIYKEVGLLGSEPDVKSVEAIALTMALSRVVSRLSPETISRYRTASRQEDGQYSPKLRVAGLLVNIGAQARTLDRDMAIAFAGHYTRFLRHVDDLEAAVGALTFD